MNVVHFSYGTEGAGAFNAAYRLHSSLKYKISSKIFCVKSVYELDNSITTSSRKFYRYILFKNLIVNIFKKLTYLKRYNPISFALLPSFFSNKLNYSDDIDIVHLHWINFEMFGINDISSIKKPIVWTIHDLWPVSGILHLNRNDSKRNSLFEFLDQYVLKQKQKFWSNTKFYLVAPSSWMLGKIKNNKVFSNYCTVIIPNPIDTSFWKVINNRNSSFSKGNKVILGFGAYNYITDQNKGYDLLLGALEILKNKFGNHDFALATFGDVYPENIKSLGFDVNHFGSKLTESEIREFYNFIDLYIFPSRIESFGQVATESMACGCPVIGFDSSGLVDIIDHKKTGYLARSFDVNDLVNGIMWYCENFTLRDVISKSCIERVKEKFSYEVVSKKYLSLYTTVLNNHFSV